MEGTQIIATFTLFSIHERSEDLSDLLAWLITAAPVTWNPPIVSDTRGWESIQGAQSERQQMTIRVTIRDAKSEEVLKHGRTR